MNIVFLVDGWEEYGIRRATLDLIEEWSWANLTLVSLSNGPFIRDCSQVGLRSIVLNLPRPPAFPPGLRGKVSGYIAVSVYNRAARARVRSAIKHLEPDLLILQYVHHLRLVPKLNRAIWIMHTPLSGAYPFDINKLLVRNSLRKNNIVAIANSTFTARSLATKSHPIQSVHLGVDTRKFSHVGVSRATRSRLHIPEDALVYGIFARLRPEKGQDVFLKALMSGEFRSANCHLLLCGGPLEGDYAQHVRHLARSGGVKERVHFTGPLSQLEELYGAVDVAVNSRVTAEALGLSIIEAMAAGKPVIAHQLGGPSEIVLNGVTGWLVPKATEQEFRIAIARSISQRDRWFTMGEAARERAVANFDRRLAARRILEVSMGSEFNASISETLSM